MLADLRRIDLTILAAVTAAALGLGGVVGAAACILRLLHWI